MTPWSKTASTFATTSIMVLSALSATAQDSRTVAIPLPSPRPVNAAGFSDAVIIQAPTEAALYDAWPTAARAVGLEGWASLICDIASGGRLTGCRTSAESRMGGGFGPAALSLVPFYRAEVARDRSGRPFGTNIIFKVSFLCGTHCTPNANPPSDPALDRPFVEKPEWQTTPTKTQITQAHPEMALRLGKEGQAIAYCVVLADGRLGSCVVGSESPSDYKFGDAVKALATTRFQMKPMMLNGQSAIPVGYAVKITIRFKLDDSSAYIP